MPLVLRPAVPRELPALTDLCRRSKAVWGYDAAFLEACRAELTLRPDDLEGSHVAVAEDGAAIVGLVQVSVAGPVAELSKLFVEPRRLRGGVGRALMVWAVGEAERRGASVLTIDADPGATAFYRRLGAVDAGMVLSGSIPGRHLPRLTLALGRRIS